MKAYTFNTNGSSLYSTAQHSTAQHRTAQHSTTQHSTAQHNTAQHSTAQHSTAQHSTAQQYSRVISAIIPTINPTTVGCCCRFNREQARSSVIAQQCWRRWAASRTSDRAPCLYDDRARQHPHTMKNKTTAATTTATTNSSQQRSSRNAPRPPSSQRPT